MSKRCTGGPTILCCAGGFGLAFAVASRLRSACAASSPYPTLLPLGAVITPSLTERTSAPTPNFLAARSSRIARTSAPAMRNAVPLWSIDWLPAVWPSFGVRPVSAETISTRASGTSSSSAAICASAVTTPWPSSALPVKTVILPSAAMRIQASSMRFPSRLPGSLARCLASCARASRGVRLKERTRPPITAVKSRRVRRGAFISNPPRRLSRAHDRADDAVMGAAAAEIGGKRGAHFVLQRVRVALEQIGRGHDHAVDAIAALRRLLFDEGGLQRMRILDRAETLNGRDLGLAEPPDRRHAGSRGDAVDQYRAGAALREPAAELGAVKLEIVAQNVKQRSVRLGIDRAGTAVDLQADGHRLLVSSPGCSSGCTLLLSA